MSWASIAARRERNHSKDSKSRQIYQKLTYSKTGECGCKGSTQKKWTLLSLVHF